MVELARAWRDLSPRRTIVLAAFAVEELAAWGSYSYVVRHAEESERTVGMINLDALGLPFPGRRVIVADAAMAAFARESAERTGWEVEGEIDASLYAWGDHNPFIDAGVPACWVWRYPPQHPYYHSAGDVLRYVDLDRTADVATVTHTSPSASPTNPKSSSAAHDRLRPSRRSDERRVLLRDVHAGQPGEANLAGATFVGEAHTAPRYRLYSIRDEHPLLIEVDEGGAAIAGQLLDVPDDLWERIFAAEPPGLHFGKIELDDGRTVDGMFGEPEYAEREGVDITSSGGWAAYVAAAR